MSPPDKAVQHRRSIRRSQDTHIPRKEGPLPYPELAGEWINEKHYSKLPRAGQMMMVAFAALKQLDASGKEAFGTAWGWNTGRHASSFYSGQGELTGPGQNPASAHIDGPKSFERLYEKGKLVACFEDKIKDIKLMSAGPERAAAIMKLSMQANLVLHRALEDLRLLTLRTDVNVKMACVYWEVMTKANPKKNDIELINAYFGDQCVTVHAFVHALRWLVKTAGMQLMPAIHTLGPNLLGYPHQTFQRVRLVMEMDNLARGLRTIKMTAEELATRMANLAEDRKHSGKDALFEKINLESEAFMQLLLAGDQRFLQAVGVSAIADALPVPPDIEVVKPAPLSPPQLAESSATVLPTLPPSPNGDQ